MHRKPMVNSDVRAVIDFTDGAGQCKRLHFAAPRRVITARCLSDVRRVILDVESASAEGYYAVGFVSYEASSAFDPALSVYEPTGFPLAWFGIFDSPVVIESVPAPSSSYVSHWEPELTPDGYQASFRRIMSAIESGETYQTNFTFRLRSTLDCDPFLFYEILRKTHPAPYCSYINTGEIAIISNSPELFVSRSGNTVRTAPMKGTVARGNNTADDIEQRDWLLASEKDRAEHIMIVDLMRSDLGKIAQIGTVTTSDPFSLVQLPSVWQMVTHVECKVDESVTLLALLEALFPSGSVTGAPKAKTMEIIRHEEISARNIYCGAIGYVKPGGDLLFNVPIRTVLFDVDTHRAECGVGGGITAGSSMHRELSEAFMKAKFLSGHNAPFDLLESILLEDGSLFLLEKHLARLTLAAAYFQFGLDLGAALSALHGHASRFPSGKRKVRLTLSRDGAVAVNSEELIMSKRVTVSLASSPIDINNPFVYHKTTRREAYDAHRKLRPDVYDVLLWNSEGIVTEFTSGNVVVNIDGKLLTPPISSGLLGGTMRELILETGEAIVEEITKENLFAARSIWLINSVRRWLPVDIID